MSDTFYSLDLLVEEQSKVGLVYGVPASAEAWQRACDQHAFVIIPIELDLQPPARLAISCAVISRDHNQLVADLVPTITRDAPSLFNRYRGYAYETDENGQPTEEPQLWKHAD